MESRKKVIPWYRVLSTSVSAEDAESITNYINSGGSFNDIATPLIYIKRLLDVEILKLYVPALTKAIEEKAPHSARTMEDTLRAVVMGRVPKRARLTKVLNRIRTQNVMGAQGENTITYSEGLMLTSSSRGGLR